MTGVVMEQQLRAAIKRIRERLMLCDDCQKLVSNVFDIRDVCDQLEKRLNVEAAEREGSELV
jgi:hypothetical protein